MSHHDEPADAAAVWDNRYAESERVWSGRVNAALADSAAALPAGRALDLGCGEGGDAIWLAERGWSVTGVDISQVALARAKAAAAERSLEGQITWVRADLDSWVPEEAYDLVSACFFQSPITLSRHDIVRRVASLVAPGGRLLVVGHASVPPWARHRHEGGGPELMHAVDEAAALALPTSDWSLDVVEDRPRQVTGPEGHSMDVLDAVVLARRLG